MKRLIHIAWKNIVFKPIPSSISLGLLVFGISIISVLLLIRLQLENKFEKDLKDVDLVMGAKGSPLQLVLSAVYHLDAPTGNINYGEAKTIMNNPQVKEAIPLAYGDSYEGYRILGTTEAYLKKYDASFQEGQVFSKPMEANIGVDVAKRTNLILGDQFFGIHGDSQGGHAHEEDLYTVVGLLERTNTVLDQLVLTPIESVWQVHDHNHGDSHHDHNEEHHEHDHHDHHEQNHEHHSHAYTSHYVDDEQDITAVLIQFKTKMASLRMPGFINRETNMQAVLPNLEINKLFYMLGIGTSALTWIAYGIMFMASLSVFFILYNRLRERQYELALMRTLGYKPKDLFVLLLSEGFLLVSLGFIVGWVLGRFGLYMLNQQAENDFNFQFMLEWTLQDTILLLVTFFIGIVSSLLPAWKAMRTNVSQTLSKK